MKHICSLVLAAVVVLLIANVVSEGVMSDGAAVATLVEGTATVYTRETPAGRPLRNNDSIAKNDRVEVQGNSKLELRLPDGGYVRLSENARLTMRLLLFEKRTGTLYLQAFLHSGKAWAKIKKHAAPASSMEVMTGAGVVTAREAVCGIEAAENASTMISVYEGVVHAVKAGLEASQAAGQASAPAEVQPVSVQAFQQAAVSAQESVVLPRDFDPKAGLNDWTRWNLQRDAREGLLSITVAPAAPTVTRGASLQFSGTAHYPDKTEKDITWFATWSSSDPAVVKLESSGAAAGTAVGAATISAAIFDLNGSTVLNVSRDLRSIAVTPASRSIVNGAVQQFKAVGTFSDKTVKDITTSVVWSSSNPGIAVVDASGRAVAGNREGSVVISALLATRRASVTLKVRRELVSIKVMPGSAMVLANETQFFGAIGTYSDGSTQDLTASVLWETSDPTIAEIDQAEPGRVVGKNRTGSATITASFKKRSGTGTLEVEAVPR